MKGTASTVENVTVVVPVDVDVSDDVDVPVDVDTIPMGKGVVPEGTLEIGPMVK